MGRQSAGFGNASISNRGIAFCATDSQVQTELGSQDTFVRASAMRFSPTACKAWVNFNGTGTVAIRGSYNVSSVTDLGVGQYQVNFTSSMVDANYVPNATGNFNDTVANVYATVHNLMASNFQVNGIAGGTSYDCVGMYVTVFGRV